MSDGRDPVPAGVGRRQFLKLGLVGAFGLLVPLAVRAAQPVPYRREDHWWGFIVDLRKCMGCGACVRACKAENAVPDGFSRTWVERYTVLKDGHVEVDSPRGALNGFPEDTTHPPATVGKAFFVPKLCNQCATAPCVQVCPVGASYFAPDGVTLVDRKRCIGCGYCVQACPYGVRYIHPEAGYADKCTLCYHRITKGLPTACAQACPVGARSAGNLKDATSNIRQLLNSSRYGVLKPALGTNPKCYYVGLDKEVV